MCVNDCEVELDYAEAEAHRSQSPRRIR